MIPDSGVAAPGRVVVTDGEFKHTLGIVRALAARGHEVHVVAQSSRAPSVHSKAVRAWHTAPAPSAAGYDARLVEIATGLSPVSVVAVGNGSVAAADRLRDAWPKGVRCALPPGEAFAIANDKARTGEIARASGVRTPRERVVEDEAAARAALAEFGSPLVLKSAREEGRKVVRYVRDQAELAEAFHDVRTRSSAGVLAQEYIGGDGWGFSALYWHGRRVRHFMHRRVREWPPSGGASACAESVPEFPELEHAGTALLDALKWHGVAMVEFKGSRAPHPDPAARSDGVGMSANRPSPDPPLDTAMKPAPASASLALMEINAKFWGSHDAALASGVNFPSDLVALMEGRELPPQVPYPPMRISWPLGGDLWHGLFQPTALIPVLRDALSPAVAHTWRADDPGPTWRELLQWARSAPGAWREFASTRR